MYPHYKYYLLTSHFEVMTAMALFRHNIGMHVYISTNFYLIVASKCKNSVIKRMPGHATQKERVTLVSCCNTTGSKDENRIHTLHYNWKVEECTTSLRYLVKSKTK